jgi:uncharacterized lipoprotein YddW (UPF0748 family)
MPHNPPRTDNFVSLAQAYHTVTAGAPACCRLIRSTRPKPSICRRSDLQIRSPKSEIRDPKALVTSLFCQTNHPIRLDPPASPSEGVAFQDCVSNSSDLGFRASFGPRISAFGSRPPLPHLPRASKILLVLAALALALASRAANYEPSRVVPPEPTREFRGAWVATVANIDWPSQKALSTQAQKAELVTILDRAVHLKLNALIFQVRPACDAFYASRIEPWSEYLTGTMGKPPEPFYDPLAFAIEEAHKRGLELHAWFNPFRARLLTSKTPAASNHITRARPQLVRHYAESLWLDPGEKEVQDYSLSVVMDVVKRYDVDGIHFDDYFYPYQVRDGSGKYMDFPDNPSWQRYGAGGKLSRDDWRRENVNSFVERVYKSIKSAKPWVKFGVSPFGIWRPKNPPQIAGLDAYASLYADSRKWLMNGWVDYLVPQLYWAITPPDKSFPALLRWWTQQNTRGRTLCAGIDATAVGRPPWKRGWQLQEFANQLRLTRSQHGASGEIFYHMTTLMNNGALEKVLERDMYQQQALMPPSPWLGGSQPGKPALTVSNSGSGSRLEIRWAPSGSGNTWLWLLQTRSGDRWTGEILPATRITRLWNSAPPDVVALSAVNRFGAVSPPTVLKAPDGAK